MKTNSREDNDKELENSPDMSPVDSDEGSSVYDSEDGVEYDDNDDDDDENGSNKDDNGHNDVEEDDDDDDEEDDEDDEDDEDEDDEEEDDDDDFEDQGSSDEDDDRLHEQNNEDESDDELALSYEANPRSWNHSGGKKRANYDTNKVDPKVAAFVHTDDLSSDDEDNDGKGNRIGKVPLHWYDEYDHVGYDALGEKVVKTVSASGGDRIDQALANQDNMAEGKYVVYDALNDRNVALTERQLELIRRVQGGAVAHPEHDANPDLIDYFSGVDPILSGLNSNRYEPKARFQPSQWEKLQVNRLLERLEKGLISMDYLTGKNKSKEQSDPNKPYALWTGDEEDEYNSRKGPQHIAAPKVPPPGHAASYIPPDEYLPTDEELKAWEDLPTKDRPHGHMIPQKFPNLRSVGAYQHSVREAFERCLDLYLCPRVLKRRLNIDPESLVPRLPRAQDLKPFPTVKCIEYLTPYNLNEQPPAIRCVTASPDGQFLISGASDGYLRLWEVETGRLIRSWNLAIIVKELHHETIQEDSESADNVAPIVSAEWNPNRSHHCVLVAIGNFIIVVATGTSGKNDADISNALFESAMKGGNIQQSNRAGKSVTWISLMKKKNLNEERSISNFDKLIGPICALRVTKQVANIRWQSKGDYFVSVSPKAGAAAVLIHQLSKGNSQQPFSKVKGETQLACFHPSKPFLYVASQQHVRIYHLVKQSMAKRLVSGCRWISSLDVHPSGDHLIIGSLDRRVIWFDLDLSATPYKTLKYHERAVRSCRFHTRYPLMASASDDGSVHVFHSMVYNDLMRNPLIVPVKILKGHTITNKFGVLTSIFHPTQPWLFTGGADGKIFLYQDI